MKNVLGQVSRGFFARDSSQACFALPGSLRVSKDVRGQVLAGIAQPVRLAIEDRIRRPLLAAVRAEFGARKSDVVPCRQWSGLGDVDVQHIADAVCEKLSAFLSTVNNDTRYWSPERAAHECSVSKRTFAQWMADGKIRIYAVGGRVLIDPQVLEEDLAKYLTRRMPRRFKQRAHRLAKTSALAASHISGQLS
jgi:excisionase family DNA binding protein